MNHGWCLTTSPLWQFKSTLVTCTTYLYKCNTPSTRNFFFIDSSIVQNNNSQRENRKKKKKGHQLDGHLEDLNLQVSTRPETITLFGQGEPYESDKVQGPVKYTLPLSPTTNTESCLWLHRSSLQEATILHCLYNHHFVIKKRKRKKRSFSTLHRLHIYNSDSGHVDITQCMWASLQVGGTHYADFSMI